MQKFCQDFLLKFAKIWISFIKCDVFLVKISFPGRAAAKILETSVQKHGNLLIYIGILAILHNFGKKLELFRICQANPRLCQAFSRICQLF